MSIRACVTISLVEQARGGPFVFWDDWQAAIRTAAELGFHAVELFLPGPDVLDPEQVQSIVTQSGLEVAAVGTGAGWVIQRLHLTHSDAHVRRQAEEFILSMIDYGAELGAPAIIGSMQGRSSSEVPRVDALKLLGESLGRLSEHAADSGVPLLYEPLNRYETDLCCTLAQGVTLIDQYRLQHVRLLADLFHMNIEEVSLPEALTKAGNQIGHVHFVDSNRRAAGLGHLDLEPVVAALRSIPYAGYVSAEALPLPDPLQAARATIEAFHRWFETT